MLDFEERVTPENYSKLPTITFTQIILTQVSTMQILCNKLHSILKNTINVRYTVLGMATAHSRFNWTA
jgi:hypothetical protein